MRRALFLLLVVTVTVALAGCGSSGTNVPAAVKAPPQTARLAWEEPYPADGAALVFGVSSFTVTRTGWVARISVENRSQVGWSVGDPRDVAARAFGVLLFPNDDLDELERRNRSNDLPAIRPATLLPAGASGRAPARGELGGNDLRPGAHWPAGSGCGSRSAPSRAWAIRPREQTRRWCGSQTTPTSSSKFALNRRSRLPHRCSQHEVDPAFPAELRGWTGIVAPMDAIVVDRLEKTYGKDVSALDGMTFSVPAGQVFGLLGPNGAGKSTTVRDPRHPQHEPTPARPPSPATTCAAMPGAVRRALGYVPQSSGVDREGTGLENLVLQGRLQGMRGPELERRARELLELFTLAREGGRPRPHVLRRQKRRLDVAMGLVHRPQVLFLDEPTTGLDPEARAAMWDELSRLASAESLTILLTTHYLEEADRLAERVAIVSPGQGRRRRHAGGTEARPARGCGRDRARERRRRPRAGSSCWHCPMSMKHSSTGTACTRASSKALRRCRECSPRSTAAGSTSNAVTVSRPSLDDVYLHYTGRDFHSDDRAGT